MQYVQCAVVQCAVVTALAFLEKCNLSNLFNLFKVAIMQEVLFAGVRFCAGDRRFAIAVMLLWDVLEGWVVGWLDGWMVIWLDGYMVGSGPIYFYFRWKDAFLSGWAVMNGYRGCKPRVPSPQGDKTVFSGTER